MKTQNDYYIHLKDWMLSNPNFDGKFKTSRDLWLVAQETMLLEDEDDERSLRAIRNLFSHQIWEKDPDMEIMKINKGKWAVRPIRRSK